MKIILKENIENLGSKGDIVKVAAGYGRNYLVPKKLAIEVTSSNAKMIEMEQAALKKNLEKVRLSYQDVIQKINDLSFSFERKSGEKDTIFGSVSVADIKEELDKLGFEIEKKKILLKEPIKRLGNYSVPVKVFLDDIAEIKIQVIPEGPAEKEAPQDAEKAPVEKKEKPPAAEAAQEDKKVTAADQPEEKEAETSVDAEADVKPKTEEKEDVLETALPEDTVKDPEKAGSDENNKTS